MSIKAYGITANLSSTTNIQATKTGKSSQFQVNATKTQDVLFAAFRIDVQGESEGSYSLQKGLVSLLEGLTPGQEKPAAPQPDLSQYLHNGRSILDFSQEEAQEMISEDGYFGVKNTSERLADFVINGAGDNLDRLRAGREGVLKGFQEAEEIWGGTLPEISYQTLEATLSAIDERIKELGGQVVDTTV